MTRELIARNGALRRTEIVSADGPKTIYLENQSGKFLMLPQEKIYADITNEHPVSVATNEESEQLELAEDHVIRATTTPATYLKLGSEIIDGHNCTKYRVIVNTMDPKVVTNSETSIWIDDALGMPVRSETISSNGSKTRMELTSVKTVVNAEQFSIPNEYHQVNPEILRKQLKSE